MNELNKIRDNLFNDFPLIYAKDINASLKINKNDYIATRSYLEKLVSENKLKLKKRPTKNKIVEKIVIVNSNGEDVIFVEKIECNCCYDTKPFEEFGNCSDGHLICKTCIMTHTKNTIYQNQSCKIKCIDSTEKCNGFFPEKLLENILDERVMKEYNNLKYLEDINEISIDDDIKIKICQHCNLGTNIGNNNLDILICMVCFKDTCLKCNQIAHYGKPCYALGNVSQNKRQEIENKMSEALILNCNKCKKPIVKWDGCNKITCVCKALNCYICKGLIKDYTHFCNKMKCACNMCHLWDNDDKKRILDAVKDNNDKDTVKLINGLL